jgi:hypothetical protein
MTMSVIPAVRRRHGDQEGRTTNNGCRLHHLDRDAVRARTPQGAGKPAQGPVAGEIFSHVHRGPFRVARTSRMA